MIYYRLRAVKTFRFYFCIYKKDEKYIETNFAKSFARNHEKEILGTSDAWSSSHLSQQTSKPAYHTVDYQIQYDFFKVRSNQTDLR